MHGKTARNLGIALLLSLILWGGYVTASYSGVPVHGAVLLPGGSANTAGQGCAETAYFCRGTETIIPAVTHSIARWFWSEEGGTISPFGWFILLSALAYGALIGWNMLRNGGSRIRVTLSPLRIGLSFLVLLWLLFTAMSLGDSGGMPYRRLFEPSAQVYQNAGTEALDTLTRSFTELKDSGCLVFLGTTDRNVNVYDVRFLCMQQSFVGRVLSQLFLLMALAAIALGFGSALLRLTKWQPPNSIVEATVAVSAGCCAMIVLLWCIALVGFFTTPVIWILLAVLAAAGWREHLHWWKTLRSTKWEVEWKWSDLQPILGWLLLSYLAFNFLTVIRPFPIGWDDLGVYLNKPRLLVSYGHLIPQMSTFQWEYMTALGFVLFGYDSLFGATVAMIINWGLGVLAVLSIYSFAKTYLPRGATLAALLYYVLPLVGHFSFADMKIDNAVFAMGSVATLCVFLGSICADHEGTREPGTLRWDLRWLALGGAFAGFAFAMKPTAIMVFMTLGTLFTGSLLGPLGFLGAASMVLAVFTILHINLSEILVRIGLAGDLISKTSLGMLFLFVGGALLVWAVARRRAALMPFLKASAVYVAAFVISMLPWLIYNNIAAGTTHPQMILTAPNNLSTVIDVEATEAVESEHPMRILPPELRVDITKCRSTAKTEELDRYWGFGTGLSHYVGLPWRTVMNADSAGYYVTTMPALLLFPLLLLLPWFWRKNGRWMRWLFVGTLFLVLQWMFLANGIPWYGIGMFFGLSIGLAALTTQAPDKWSRWIAGILLAVSMLFALANREWQYDNMRNLYEYMLGKVSGEAMQERTIPHYDDVRDLVLERAKTMPDRPFVYRVGTFIPYFIPKNLEYIPLADNQLELFKCLNQEGDPKLTLKRFQALGFNSIIFDTNTHTIERDPNGTLHQKVRAFLDFLNTPGLGFKVIVNDPDGGIAFLLMP